MMWTTATAPDPWWPLLIVMFLVLVAAGAAVAVVLARGRGGGNPGPGRPAPGADRGLGQAAADPLAVLRERYARGEIGHDEFERYLDHLVRTEPSVLRYDGERD